MNSNLLLFACCARDYRFFMILVPSLIGILVCYASPTFTQNGVRYALPVIFSLYFIVGVFFMRVEERLKSC